MLRLVTFLAAVLLGSAAALNETSNRRQLPVTVPMRDIPLQPETTANPGACAWTPPGTRRRRDKKLTLLLLPAGAT